MKIEKWKEMKRYEGLYLISNEGRVMSNIHLKGNGSGYIRKTRIVKGKYPFIILRGKTEMIHRLVAENWIDDWDSSLCVDHIDGNRQNNHVKNLRMVSYRGNAMAGRKQVAGVSSRFRGVSWHKASKKWKAFIKKDGKTRYIGSFLNQRDAAHAYNYAAICLGFFPEALNAI